MGKVCIKKDKLNEYYYEIKSIEYFKFINVENGKIYRQEFEDDCISIDSEANIILIRLSMGEICLNSDFTLTGVMNGYWYNPLRDDADKIIRNWLDLQITKYTDMLDYIGKERYY